MRGDVLFPYLLFRFSAALAPPSRRAELVLGGVTFAVLLATVALPLREDPWPAWFQAYVVALLVQWAIVLLVVAHRLWRAGAALASVARRRMRSLAFAAPVLVLAVLVAGLGPAERPPGLDLAFRLLVLTSVLGFFLAFAPPRVVRALWRQPEEERLRRATQSLMRATAADEVVAAVLPTMAAIVGAQAVAMLDAEDRVVGSHGLSPAALAELEQDSPPGTHAAEALEHRVRPLRLALPAGRVLVWASPYAPVFGEDEIELLRTLGGLAELALERARLFAQERDARRVLEQADELKGSFIALASHELRGPATVVYGLAELLHVKARIWSPERQAESRRMLYEHARTLVHMIEQLLDLSRLEAGAIEIAPERASPPSSATATSGSRSKTGVRASRGNSCRSCSTASPAPRRTA